MDAAEDEADEGAGEAERDIVAAAMPGVEETSECRLGMADAPWCDPPPVSTEDMAGLALAPPPDREDDAERIVSMKA